jgi:hypothetical protein
MDLLKMDPKKLAGMVVRGDLQLDEIPMKTRRKVVIFVAQLEHPDAMVGDPDDTVEVKGGKGASKK